MAIVSTLKGILWKHPLIYYALRKVHKFLFDLGWKLYWRGFSDPERHVKTLVSYAKEIINPKLVIDLGCGDGPYRQVFSRLGGRYFGCDMFRTDSVNVIADAHILPFREGSIPITTIFQSLEHFHSPWVVMKEVARVLMRGGVVLITVPQYWPQHGHPSDYFRFTRNGLIALCESNNLKVMKCWSWVDHSWFCIM